MDFITEKDRIYATDPSGNVIAEVTFPSEDGVSTIDHTFVDPSLRGEGIAGKLVKLAADKILAEGNKIAATCSYVQRQRDPPGDHHRPRGYAALSGTGRDRAAVSHRQRPG